jgi:2-amino-4-hydroxy-6-hydroxymethyldihydropteridine diphosphokinase
VASQSAIRNLQPAIAFLALGSNLGDSIANVRAAMDELQKLSVVPLFRSSLWQSTPVDCPPGSPLFINAVVGLVPAPGETPETLLRRLQGVEQTFGRQPKKVLNESRPLDLDLIAWGAETRNTPALILPHPRARQRRFVLAPLAEIAPEFVFPGQTKSVATRLAELITDERLTRLA